MRLEREAGFSPKAETDVNQSCREDQQSFRLPFCFVCKLLAIFVTRTLKEPKEFNFKIRHNNILDTI